MLWLCAAIFAVALGIRLLHRDDGMVAISQGGTMLAGLIRPYEHEADRILGGGGLLIPRSTSAYDEACMLAHPPGYGIFAAAVFWLFGHSYQALALLQIIADSVAVVLLFLTATRLLPVGAAAAGAAFAALSPQLAYYSVWRSPDSLAVLPILLAVYLLVRSIERPRFVIVLGAGVSLGLSCWLRTNALFLAPFMTLFMLPFWVRGSRFRASAILLLSMALTIAPITIRNLIVFHQFIPVSLSTGLNLIEGIGEMDKENRFGLPYDDAGAAALDAERYGRPDYAYSLWTPDGPERDRARFSAGLAVLRSNPAWFAGAMLRRAGFMLRYNDSGRHEWPFNTALAPVLSAEAPYRHPLEVVDGTQPAWSSSPDDFERMSQQAYIHASEGGYPLFLQCDESEFGDQAASEPIAVLQNLDYLFKMPIQIGQGEASVRVTTVDRQITLGSALLHGESGQRTMERSERRLTEGWSGNEAVVPFSTGRVTAVRVVLSNNGGRAPRSLQIGPAQLFALGPTGYLWTRYPRVLIRAIQKKLMTSGRLIPLVFAGIALIGLARRWPALVALIAVPLYYLMSHSGFSIEYRYILAMHYYLLAFAGTAVFCAITVFAAGVQHAWRAFGPETAMFLPGRLKRN